MLKKLCLLSLLFWGGVQAQALPQARLNINPTTGDLRTEFRLDASQSLNPLGNNQDLEYQFRTERRATRTPFSRTSSLSFFPADTGTFTAEVVVRDRQTGATAIAAQRYTVRETTQRQVQIRVSDTNPAEGQSITYEAVVFGNGITRSGLQSRWDFNSDGRWDTGFQPTLIASFSPPPGRAFPTVEVRFPDGTVVRERGFEIDTNAGDRNQNQRSNFVTTQRNNLRAPVIEVSPLRNEIRENTNVSFDGSKTETLPNSYLEWVVESRTIRDKEKIDYIFRTNGSKTVILRHCFENQPESCLETSTSVEIVAQPNDQFLTLSWQNMSDRGRRTTAKDYAVITATDKVRVTARPQGQPSRRQTFLYRWDFEGDGQWDTNFGTDASVEYTYNQTGTFVLLVEAIPSVPTRNFESLTTALPIYVERNRAPFGDFNFTQANNFVGERVTYTAQAEDPESGNSVEVRFDSDADGVWDSDFRNQRSWWWIYDTPGEYEVRMQIRDPQGRLEEMSKTMTILPMPEPEIKVLVSHRTQTENGSVLLDARESLGRQLTYKWTVQGRNDINLSGGRTNLRLPLGNYQVQLTIRDRLGVQDSVVFPVSFVANQPPSAAPPTDLDTFSGFTPNTTNIINRLPGARAKNNYIIPPGGAPSIVSPFQIDAGQNSVSPGFVSGMRALP